MRKVAFAAPHRDLMIRSVARGLVAEQILTHLFDLCFMCGETRIIAYTMRGGYSGFVAVCLVLHRATTLVLRSATLPCTAPSLSSFLDSQLRQPQDSYDKRVPPSGHWRELAHSLDPVALHPRYSSTWQSTALIS